jgi:lipopolysaccharide/colanic/teichoic acid biosynthesis glycosyltransferase
MNEEVLTVSVTVFIAAAFYGLVWQRLKFDWPPGKLLSRLIDSVLAVIMLLLLWPLMLVVALIITATSPGPALVIDRVRDRDGTLLCCHRFHTRLANGVEFTSIGRVLHRFKIDDLPQLFNVVRGDMRFKSMTFWNKSF